jgi:hypothetical protein
MSDPDKQHRQNTNPYNSGGGGFDVEDRYTALCMACWLSGVRPPGCVVPASHSLTSLAVQAPKEVWLFDDLILTFEGNGPRQQVGTSIKSGDYLKDGLPPKDLVEDVWRQVLGQGVRVLAENDELVIAAPPIAPEHAKDWRELGEWARAETDDALEANVAKANVGNDFKRSLIKAFRCPEDVAEGRTGDQLRVGQILRRLRLVEHDYRSPSDSRLVEEGIKRCSEALVDGSRENAESLWKHLLRVAEKIRPNAGQLTFEQLLGHIRGEHRLSAHPDDAADWSLVGADTARRLDRISDSIGGLKLNRELVVKQIRVALSAGPLVALVAESGEGKTVCAKRVADAVRAEKHRVIWLEPDQICSANGLGHQLGLHRPLEALLPRVVETSAFLFADQVDQYDDFGLKNLFSLLRQLSPWKVVLTTTPEGWRRIEQRVLQALAAYGSAELLSLPRLSPDEIREVGELHPNLRRILDDRRLRRIVLRPRVLDLVAQEAITHAAAAQWVSEADVIDWFFDTVVERKKGDGRRPTVVRLAARLADDLATSIPEDEIDPAEADRVAALHADRILRVQDGRLAFDHPLLADWSKRQYLVGRENLVADDLTSNKRRDNPAWHRGLTLYGLRLVEQRKDVQAFLSLLNALEPNDKATSCGDSLLASVVTATDPASVLDTLWPALSEDEDLFQRVLRVNHLAGTVPHPQMPNNNLRQPVSWHYPLLVKWLHSKLAEVVRLAPAEVAIIAETWLRAAAQFPELPARNEAATLSLVIATAARADWGEHDRFPFDAKRPAYRALLAAVPVDPANVLNLLRRCAERVPDDPSARKHRSSGRLAGFVGSSYKSAPSSPDAPFRPVDHGFREVGHDWIALEPLVVHSPETAVEVILATLLLPAERHPFVSHGIDAVDGAASSEHGWSPAMWWHGPFARLLRMNERVGIDLILRLVNYVTEVWQYDAEHSKFRHEGPIPYMEIEVDSVFRRWPGGGLRADNVFSWHSLGHRCPRSVQCALMALEHYLYQAEADCRQVAAAIEQILKGSKSAAFAGLLAAIGNHRPTLLQGPLQPLLTCAEAVWDDELRSHSREDKTCAGIGLPLRSQFIQEQVTTWYCMKHRDSSLLAQIMLFVAQKDPPAFLERVRNRLAQRIANGEAGDETRPLQLLAAWYDPANWRVTETPQGLQIEFIRPPHLQASADETRKMRRDQDVLFLPTRARRLIDEGKAPGDDGMEQLWARFDEFADSWRRQDGGKRVADAIAGIAAVAVILRPDWLTQVDGRYETAVDLIDSIAASPPEAPDYDSPDQLYSQGWDAFYSDVAGTLYALDPGYRRCRDRAVRAAIGYHYITVGHLLRAFIRVRLPNRGPSLGSLINLVIQWAALREACRLDDELRARGPEEVQAIAELFLDGRMEEQVQPWIAVADQRRGVLCESTMIQVVESAPRPSKGDAFFVEPAWPLVVEQGIDWLINAATISKKLRDGDSEDDHFEVGSGHRVGHKLQNAIVRLAAEAVVHASSENWVNNIVQKCLTLPGKRYGARESFASWFAAYSMGDSNDELPDKALARWSLFAETVLDLDESNSEADELPKSALGLSLLSQYSWPQQATQAAVALSTCFERWIKSTRRDVRDAAVFAYFLSRPAAEPLRQNGIEWIASNPRFIEPQQWRHESEREPVLKLLESVTKEGSLEKQSSQLRNAIIKLLAATAAAGDARAVDLQRSLGIIG